MNNITADLVRELLAYDPNTGHLYWAKARKSVVVGERAGYVWYGKRRYISIFNRRWLEHRVVWLHYYGDWPNGEIDHIDGNPLNNAINNLRAVDRHTNMHNIFRVRSDSKIGLKGVSRHGNGYRARIIAFGKWHYVGYYKTAQEAHAAYIKAKEHLHINLPTAST